MGLAVIIALCGQASFAEWSEGPCPPPPGSYCIISHGAFLTFGPNGKHIAIVSGDEIRIFDLTDGSLLRTFRTEKPSLSFGIPSFSPDGELIAAPMSGDLIGIWDVTTGEEMLTISAPTGPYLRVAFSPVGGSLASISGGKVELWDTDRHRLQPGRRTPRRRGRGSNPQGMECEERRGGPLLHRILERGLLDHVQPRWILPLRRLRGWGNPPLGSRNRRREVRPGRTHRSRSSAPSPPIT